ncbi:MAG: hypothetical protein AAF297_08390 [Planctomycetota bacterium]
MKNIIAIAALAGLATAASAQNVDAGGATLARVLASVNGSPASDTVVPADGDTVDIEIILDATDYTGDFFAWQQYNFNVTLTGDAGTVEAGQINVPSESPTDTADSLTPFGNQPASNANGFNGRRPGFGAFSGSNNGGSRFGPGAADTANDGELTSVAGGGSIGGRQQAFTTPEDNFGISVDPQYAAFRFSFVYEAADGIVTVDLADVVLNAYNSDVSADSDFISNFAIAPAIVGIPAPASAALLGLGGLAAARRRR